MQPFVIPVLDKQQTLTEKLVSLVRCSLANEYQVLLSSKIRHFYDLYYLSQDEETNAYLSSDKFQSDFEKLFLHDQRQFSNPEGWQGRRLEESPLLISINEVWKKLEPIYLKELDELAYGEIPTSAQILDSIRTILSHLL